MELTRKQVIEELKAILEEYWNVPLSKDALEYAISSLKADEAYQIMYEGREIFTKADMIAMLDKIRAEMEQLPTKTITNWDGCLPDIDYPESEYIDVTKNGLLSIIDKYKAEIEP